MGYGFLGDMDSEFKLTDLRTNTSYYYRNARDMYNRLMIICKDHALAEEVWSWADLAPAGSEWEDLRFRVTICGEVEF